MTRKEEAVKGLAAPLPLFTGLPTRRVPGNHRQPRSARDMPLLTGARRVSAYQGSRKLNIYYYSCWKALHMGSLTSRVPRLRRTSCRYKVFSETQRAEGHKKAGAPYTPAP